MNSRSNKSWWGQAIHNRLIALVLAMLVIVPLIATPAEASWHGSAAFVYEGLALVLMVALLWRTRWNLTRSSLIQFAKTGSHLPIALFGGYAALSMLIAGRNPYGEQALLCLAAGILLYYVVATQFRRSEQLAKLVDTLVFLTIGAALLGFSQYSAGHSPDAVGLFGDHQLFGSFLMILLPLVGVQAVTEKKPGRQMAAQIATVFGVTALLISQARSAWIGAVAGLVVLAILTLVAASRTRSGLRGKHETVLPLVLIAVAAGFFLMLWPQTAHVFSRATSISKFTAVDTWLSRQHTWNGALKMIAARPVFGHGMGQYPVVQNHFTHEGIPLVATMRFSTLGEQAHNFYLQTAAELGIIGLLLFAGILITFWITGLYRVLHMDAGIRRSLLLGSLASTIAFAVDAFASPSWQLGQVSMFLWLSMGIGVCCLQKRTRAEEAEEVEPAMVPTRVSRPIAVFAALGAALLLPTAVVSADPGYGTPLNAFLRPKTATINDGATIQYSLFVNFKDAHGNINLVDVSSSSGTTFTYTVGGGVAPGAPGSGVNDRDYTGQPGENDIVTVTGTYTQSGSGSVSDTGKLKVHP
jgi:O-antigen ligase